MNLQIEETMHGKKRHHMVKEADSRIDRAFSRTIKLYAERDFRFICLPFDLGLAHINPAPPGCASGWRWHEHEAPPLPQGV